MACRLVKTLPWSQRGPLHPPAQLHMNDPSLLRHCAPFWQGLVPHSNVSELVSVFQRKNQHCGPKVVYNSYVHRVNCFCLIFFMKLVRILSFCLLSKRKKSKASFPNHWPYLCLNISIYYVFKKQLNEIYQLQKM